MRPMIRRLLFLLGIVALSCSCSTVFQKSVHSDSVDCSTSRAYYITDLVIAGAYAFVVSGASRDTIGFGPRLNEPAAYIPIPVFAASAGYGIYKRHNCTRWRETAPPEEWARVEAAK